MQKDSPGADKESNWSPALDGPIYVVMRPYWPKEVTLDGSWKPPAIPQNQVRLHFIQPASSCDGLTTALTTKGAHIGGKYALWRTGYCTELLIADARGRNSTELEIR